MSDTLETPQLNNEIPKEEVFIRPDEGFELLKVFVNLEDLPLLVQEIEKLDKQASDKNIVKSRWETPERNDENGIYRNEYHRTEALQETDDPLFTETYPVISRIIDVLKERTGFLTLSDLNINRYRPGSRIPPHEDPESKVPSYIYTIGVEGSGIFRVWPDLTTTGYIIHKDETQSIALDMEAGDGMELLPIARYEVYDEESFETHYEYTLAPDEESLPGHYVTRYHSAENPYESDRVILLVGLKA